MEIDYFERSKSKLFEAPGGFFLDRGHFFLRGKLFKSTILMVAHFFMVTTNF